MKKYIFLALTVMSLSACNKKFLDEEPRGRLASEGFFKSKADLDLAVNAIYNKLNRACNIDEFDCPLMGADDVTTKLGSNKEDFRAFDQFNANNTVERLGDTWRKHFAVVNFSNFVINGYTNATSASKTEREQAAGQAYFLRAWAYFYIERVWSKVPIITTNEASTTIGKSTPEEVYALIVDDLQKAEEFLPAKWDVGDKRKGIAPTKGAAKSLLASVYLNMAGYPVKDVAKYALASAKAKEVLDDAGSYGYSLLNNFADLWRDNTFNSEQVFSAVYNNLDPADGNFYNYNVRAPHPSQPEEEGGWDDYFAELNFYFNFPNGPRKDATFQTIIRVNNVPVNWTLGIQKHPYYKKMRAANGSEDIPGINNNWQSSRTNQIIRFAEVKLIYAEAKAMSTGPDASAYKEVNDVRRRAGLADLQTGLSQTAFRDSVVKERGWEFAGNEFCHRWFDLVRLEMVEQVAASRNAGEIPITRQPTKADYFAPIPFSEVQLNPNLGK